MREDITDWLTLANCTGLGPIVTGRLIDRFGSPGSVLHASFSDLRATDQVGPELARSIRSADKAWADTQLAACRMHEVDILTLADDEYPAPLLETFTPPPLLYVKGHLSTLALPGVAVVGARTCTQYGRHVARMYAEELARRGVCVVSGLALGIDACAHEGALKGGTTAAVMGTGLDHPYPKTNLSLFHQICEQGIVISEFPMGTGADPKHFPRRNQTISGLSQGVLVVEGGPGSGSLLTAQFALEQNREVFAVPGPVTSSKSLGPHNLIRQGAHLTQSPDCIFAELRGMEVAPHLSDTPSVKLSGLEGRIVDCLASETGVHVDTIADELSLPSHQVLPILLQLELSSYVDQLPGKRFSLKH
jgi:DNA processing protein